MISEKYKFAYVHIPKCGGTSVEKLFTPDFIANPHVFGFTYKKDRPELYRWTTIRNTWDRIVSCYHYGIKKFKKDINFKKFVMDYISPNGNKFAYTDENRFFGRDGHMIYVIDHVTKLPLINFYVNLWDAKKHMEILFDILKIDLKILNNYKKHNSTKHGDYRKLYKKEKVIDAVYGRYKMEIDFFGFEFENPNKFKEDLVGIDLKL